MKTNFIPFQLQSNPMFFPAAKDCGCFWKHKGHKQESLESFPHIPEPCSRLFFTTWFEWATLPHIFTIYTIVQLNLSLFPSSIQCDKHVYNRRKKPGQMWSSCSFEFGIFHVLLWSSFQLFVDSITYIQTGCWSGMCGLLNSAHSRKTRPRFTHFQQVTQCLT